MPKISDLISHVRSSNKFLEDDNSASDRFIYSLIVSNASLLLKREINLRRLTTSDNVYQSLECLELERVPATECDITGCNYVRQSKIELPDLEEGLYSYFIQGVFNIVNSVEIFPTTMREWMNYCKLRVKPKNTFYIVKNKRLIVLDEDVEMVNLYARFATPLVTDPCMPMWEVEFKYPPYLLKPLYDLCDQALVNYFRKGEDVDDDNLEKING